MLLLGIIGSFFDGFLGRSSSAAGNGFVMQSSWIGFVIGAVIVLLIYLQIKFRRHSRATTVA